MVLPGRVGTSVSGLSEEEEFAWNGTFERGGLGGKAGSQGSGLNARPRC